MRLVPRLVTSDEMNEPHFSRVPLQPWVQISAIIHFIQLDSTWKQTDGDDTESHPQSPAMCAQQRLLVSEHSSLTIDHTSQCPKDLGSLSLGKHPSYMN